MQFHDGESYHLPLSHSVVALDRESLLVVPLSGAAAWLKDAPSAKKLQASGWQWPESGGIVANMTGSGADLFLWAHGYRDYYSPDLWARKDLDLQSEHATTPDNCELG